MAFSFCWILIDRRADGRDPLMYTICLEVGLNLKKNIILGGGLIWTMDVGHVISSGLTFIKEHPDFCPTRC